MKNLRKFGRRARITALVFIVPMLAATSVRAGEIHDAAAAGNLNKVRALIEADSTLLESKDKNGKTPLNLACMNGFSREPAIATFLIDKGANVNTKNNNGFTPLHGACSIAGSSGSDFDLVQRLVARGADVNAQDNRGITPLRSSVGTVKIARFLIEHGADVNASDAGFGGTILQFALTYDSNEDMSTLLIESGATRNRKDAQGNTELHLAAMNGFADVIRLLVKHGSDVNAVNNSNRTALYYAAKHGYRKAADALIAAGAKESAIVETNYGKAPQLSATLKQGEAYLWYMKLGGYVVKTKDHLLILWSFFKINTSLDAGLLNGQLNPNELAGQNITVLTRYPGEHFFKSDEGRLAKLMPEVEWVFFSIKPIERNAEKLDIPCYHLVGPDESISFGESKVHTTPFVKHVGMGFLFEVDGVKIFDGQSYLSTNEASQVENYRKEIDSLKTFGPIDIAILRVRTDRGNTYEPYLYLIDQLSPKTVYLTEGAINPDEYSKCANFLRTRNIQVKYPETTGIAGDRFHYLRDRASATSLPGAAAGDLLVQSVEKKAEKLHAADASLDYLGQEPPGLVSRVFAPGVISLPGRYEHDICFSKDGCECYFTTRNAGWTVHKIMVTYYENGKWIPPVRASFSDNASLCPSLADNDQSMYFSRCGGIWKAQRTTSGSGTNRGGWSQPNLMPAPISPPHGEWGGHISSLGNLWFCSWRPGGLGKCDLWFARSVDKQFKETINLRDLNTETFDCNPVPGPNENYFIWTSDRAGGFGKSDLYISFADGKGGWTAPKNLGPIINTPGGEGGASLSPDHKYLFFSRGGTSKEDSEDIYWVSVKAFLPDPNSPIQK